MRFALKDRTANTVVTYFRATRGSEIRKYLPQKATTETEASADFEETMWHAPPVKVLLKSGFVAAETLVEGGVESKYFQKKIYHSV